FWYGREPPPTMREELKEYLQLIHPKYYNRILDFNRCFFMIEPGFKNQEISLLSPMNLPVEPFLIGIISKRCGIFTGWRYLYT
ncbi:MAG TPA: hypothetical protein VN922_21250, partial [Bacteroidia bacterium]|nr:hypothetical protein [Bacteroidia bacterium]